MARQQAPHERLTRSQFNRKQAKRRRREEAGWAARSGPVKVRIDPELAAAHARDRWLESIAPEPKR